MIRLENVSKTFVTKERQVRAVEDVSLSIDAGEIYGIIGFSGAGKSTLVRCINLLEVPTKGEVFVDGENLTQMTKKQLRGMRQKMGMIFQHFNLLAARTVFENVAYPLRCMGYDNSKITQRVTQLLELVELTDKVKDYPSQLSGGQKQRVAIARALASDPKVLLCDEATSALDPQTTASILKLLKDVNEKTGITMVVITHEMGVVKEICHKVAIMDEGRVVERGDVYKIFSDPQKEITKDFIGTTSNLQKVYGLIAEKASVVALKEQELLMQFSYTEDSTSTPQVSTISRNYQVDVNILFGDIEVIGGRSLGGLVVIMSGDRKNVELAVRHLIGEHVKVEVLLDGRTN